MMTCTTAGNVLCNAFVEFSRMCWKDLSDAAALNNSTEKFSLSEESLTDYRLLELGRAKAHLASRGYHLSIVKFTRADEGKKTGADWQWIFVGGGRWIGLRVQAKKLYGNLNYQSLRQKNKKGKFQYNQLIEDAERDNLFPVYCFYNYSTDSTYRVPAHCPCFEHSEDWGCSIADAYAVRRRAVKKESQFDKISKVSAPLPHVFCCEPFRNWFDSFPDFIAEQLQVLKANSGTRKRGPGVQTGIPAYVRLIEALELGIDITQYEALQNLDGVMVIREEG